MSGGTGDDRRYGSVEEALVGSWLAPGERLLWYVSLPLNAPRYHVRGLLRDGRPRRGLGITQAVGNATVGVFDAALSAGQEFPDGNGHNGEVYGERPDCLAVGFSRASGWTVLTDRRLARIQERPLTGRETLRDIGKAGWALGRALVDVGRSLAGGSTSDDSDDGRRYASMLPSWEVDGGALSGVELAWSKQRRLGATLHFADRSRITMAVMEQLARQLHGRPKVFGPA